MEILSLNTRVKTDKGNFQGIIVGYAVIQSKFGYPLFEYVVQLDHGFYSPDNELYISCILVHSDNIQTLED